MPDEVGFSLHPDRKSEARREKGGVVERSEEDRFRGLGR